MTAEEKLRELREKCRPRDEWWERKAIGFEQTPPPLYLDSGGFVHLSPEHIDLIANLVVERLNKEG